MKQTLEHLPIGKREELAFVVATLRDGFQKALQTRTMPRFRSGKLLKIILFGSYARGDWVDDPQGRYFSDYDLLIIVNHEDLSEVEEFWRRPDEVFLREFASGDRLRTQPNFIVHSLDDVNEQLRLGRYFFIDIVRDGVVLFEEPNVPFALPTPLSAADAFTETTAHFGKWFNDATGLLDTARLVRERGRANEAAFHLHQAAERAYHGLILTLTLYSAKTHRLNLLRDRAEALDPRLLGVWTRNNKFERQGFDLIRRAYVEARYSPHFQISDEHLAWLEDRVAALLSAVEIVALERIESLRTAVA